MATTAREAERFDHGRTHSGKLSRARSGALWVLEDADGGTAAETDATG